MPVISGLDGVITFGSSDIADLTEWSFSMTSNNKEYGSSDTAGHTNTTKGRKSGSVSFTVKNNTGDSIWGGIGDATALKIGDQVSLSCKEDATRTWTIPCRIETMELTVSVEDAEVEEIACTGQAHGSWTYPDSSVSA